MQNDEEIGIAGIGLLLGGLVFLCVLAVVCFGIHSTETTSASSAIAIADQPLKGDAVARIYFEVGSAELPNEAGGAIETVRELASKAPTLNVLIAGYHDPTGDPSRNSELARRRALQTKLELMAVGVPGERVFLRKPEGIPGDADLQEARRVDIHLQ